MTAVCSADSWRSVLKMLNSASSCPNAAPVSADARVAGSSSPSSPSPTIRVCDDAQQLVAIVGEVLLHVDGAAGERHDRDQIGGRHLRADELAAAARSARTDRGVGIAVMSK